MDGPVDPILNAFYSLAGELLATEEEVRRNSRKAAQSIPRGPFKFYALPADSKGPH